VTTLAHLARQKTRFLAAYAQTGNVSASCRDAGVPRRNVYNWQEHDDAFAHAFRDAEIQAVDALETEARRRACGYDTTVVDQRGGEHTVTKYSDVLLIFLLKGARPEKYRDQVVLPVSEVVRAYRGLDPDRV
jgi:hypothetical protein